MKKILDWAAIIVGVVLIISTILFMGSLISVGNYNGLVDILIFAFIFMIVSVLMDRATSVAKEKGWIK